MIYHNHMHLNVIPVGTHYNQMIQHGRMSQVKWATQYVMHVQDSD